MGMGWGSKPKLTKKNESKARTEEIEIGKKRYDQRDGEVRRRVR
jgi:hypothetical protein